MRTCGLFDFILLFMVSASPIARPFSGGARVMHIRCAMAQAYRHACRTAPILAFHALVIFEQLTVAGLQRARDLPLEQAVWHRCSTWAPFARVGYQLSLSRCHCIKLHSAS